MKLLTLRQSIPLVLAATVAVACKRKTEEEPPPPTGSTVASGAPVGPAAPPTAPAAPTLDKAQVLAMLKPLPANFDSPTNPTTDAKLALGRTLYFDPRLSKNHDVSCNSCHGLDTFGVDGLAVSKGHRGQLGTRNSPTVYNAAGHIAQFWDGRAADVEAQAKGPVLNPIEMGMPDEAHVVTVLRSIPGYVEAFAQAFPGEAEPVTYDNMAKAIGAFERRLVTPAPFDRYLGGDDAALSADAKHGLAVFMASGCTACHNGPLLGGATYMKTGLVAAYADTVDTGRAQVTQAEADRFVFKVPSLRNVARTAPYFHDGKVPDLATAVREMGRLQLGRQFTDEEIRVMAAFLDALTGEPPAALISQPELPKSSAKTPRPDPS